MIGRVSIEELRKEHAEYMLSEHWAFLRDRVFTRDKLRCASCTSADELRGHHIVYRRPMTLCDADDILTLCRKCHDTLHEQLNATGGHLRAIRTRSATLSFLNRLRMFSESRPMFPAANIGKRKSKCHAINGVTRSMLKKAINNFRASGYNPGKAGPLIQMLKKYSSWQ